MEINSKTLALVPLNKQQQSIVIDPEFSAIVTPHSELEYLQLKENILRYGCLCPLIVQKGTNLLLDGRARYQICCEHNIPFKVLEIELASRFECIEWIIANEVGRRNSTPLSMANLRGQLYNLPKNENGIINPEGKKVTEGQIARKLSKKFNVTPKTIKNDGKLVDCLNAIEQVVGVGTKAKILSGEIPTNKTEAIEIGTTAKKHPEIVKQAFLNHGDGTRILYEIKDKVAKKPDKKPFPYKVGEIIRINAARNRDLFEVDGYIGCILETFPERDLALVKTWKGTYYVRTKNVVHQFFNLEAQKEGAKVIIERLHRLGRDRDKSISSVLHAALKDISLRPVYCLSDEEEAIISNAEVTFGLNDTVTAKMPPIHPENRAAATQHQQKSWIVSMVNKNINNLRVVDFRHITEKIAKFRPDDVVAIVSEFLSDRQLAKNILGSINVQYSDLIAEIKGDNWSVEYN